MNRTSLLLRVAILTGIALSISAGACYAEIKIGIETLSTSLYIDGLHVGTDMIPLIVALQVAVVLWQSTFKNRKGKRKHYKRRMLRRGAYINAWLLVFVIALSLVQTVYRLGSVREVNASDALGWSFASIFANAVQWALLPHGHGALHVSTLAHIVADLMSSIAATLSNLVIAQTAWNWVDPVTSLIVCVYLIRITIRIFKQLKHGNGGHHDGSRACAHPH